MATTTPGPYNWEADEAAFEAGPQVPPMPTEPPTIPQQQQQQPESAPRRPRGAGTASNVGTAAGAAAGAFVGGVGSILPPVNVTVNGGGAGKGGGGRGNAGGGTYSGPGSGSDRHQGDRLIYAVERIQISNNRDIVALAKAINYLGRELHLILGMRAEELNGVLSTYKGKWYTFGASSRVKARLVSAHLKVSAEAAKALGVGALKMAAAFDRHFVQPEREARAARSKSAPRRREFTIEGD
ncbi:hypothetical protein AB0O42_35540 [Streptomyces sp. NPDC089922]|uniref:hypothetical protein n=1 Tax=Streptomyces sp. NPDC089922 TaxID=3155189 RepID=UPI0034154473